MNTQSLAGQTAIVTGGAKGYGAGIAAALKERGANVVITGRDGVALDAAAKSLGVRAVRADVTSPLDWDTLFETVLDGYGRLDILINNAGGGVLIAPVEAQTDEAVAQCVALNFTGAVLGCQRAARLFKAQGSGVIINVSSVAGRHAWPSWGVYGGAKAGLTHFTKSLYSELRPHGVRVTTFTPSWGATEFDDASGLHPRDPEVVAQCIKPAEIGLMIAQICELPAHLCVQETILWPTVQDVSPL